MLIDSLENKDDSALDIEDLLQKSTLLEADVFDDMFNSSENDDEQNQNQGNLTSTLQTSFQFEK